MTEPPAGNLRLDNTRESRYQTFVEAGRQHYGGVLAGHWILTGGLGGTQPLAATMAGASLLSVECRPNRIEMRLKTGYLDCRTADLDEALAKIGKACGRKDALSVGLLRNAAETTCRVRWGAPSGRATRRRCGPYGSRMLKASGFAQFAETLRRFFPILPQVGDAQSAEAPYTPASRHAACA